MYEYEDSWLEAAYEARTELPYEAEEAYYYPQEDEDDDERYPEEHDDNYDDYGPESPMYEDPGCFGPESYGDVQEDWI